MKKLKKYCMSMLAIFGATCLTTSFILYGNNNTSVAETISSAISKVNGSVQSNIEDYYDETAIYKLPETVNDSDEISVIVSMETETVFQAYENSTSYNSLSEYATSSEAHTVSTAITREADKLKKLLRKNGISFTEGENYDTLLSGFEVTIQAKDFDTLNDLLSGQATVIVGEEYAPAETEVVTNDVDVYETGIFDSSSAEYQGDGVVVAILDTGLDYTHTAFSVDNFTTSQETFTLQSVSAKVGETVASTYSTLTGEDVYISKKVPYAYDYADKDSDVFPINSEHGTHVAGIIAGKDDVITGVAPNAQLAIMKVFSDTATGAKTSWILAALEDCVILGVDVINMSLGTSCGFSREVDKENVNNIYDNIKAAGISLIAAASNDYNATYGSSKNGSNGLTSNPDSGTVGSPSTYDAALSVASVDGVKTSYLVSGGDIIYFNEATNSSAKKKDFVSDILKTVGDNVTSYEFDYVTIPGIGRSSDYTQDDSYYAGKIVLVKRGTTTFEDKVRIALKEKGAAGIIIYNNVSGTISMSVGSDIGAVCSISQDDGEKLAAVGTGKITISTDQKAGPFMSDFSSWGPTSDLKIKPEITAHGGEILSAVPGQSYDRLSGTSMAAPNQSGATALIRQYVKYSNTFGTDISATKATAIVNQLMMSTTDIVYNKNGLPYAVRKQGSGLVNITKALTSASYITTYDTDGNAMDKTKLELGDDKTKSGVYTMTFDINNISSSKVSYDIDAIVMTEGVSSTYTSHGDTTVTQDGRLLSGSKTTIQSVTGGEQSGSTVSVNAKSSAKVTVQIVLSDDDKSYMDTSFENGMYVEGFITLKASNGTTVDMNIPYLAFYGDWTEAPIFDEEYYDTNVDEINTGLDDEDKLMADAYATRVIGGLYSDYIATLGSYYFVQNPSATQIAASKEHIALSNQQGTSSSSTINSIRYIYAGLLRNVKEVDISIVEDSTGKEVYSSVQYNQRKSYSSGSTVYGSSIDIDYSAIENNLKNNTQYTVTVTTYIDYGEKSEQNNKRNTFTFPLYIDIEAPVVTDVSYYTEYDTTTKKTKLYADLSIYDNHYAMGVQFGQITRADPSTGYSFSLSTFGKYVTPVYSSFNSTSIVTIELTDYVNQIKESAGLKYNSDGTYTIDENNNSFIAICYDYAMNSATYELRLPDEILSMYFESETVSLSPNETLDVSSILNVYPIDTWIQVLDFSSSDTDTVDVINNTILAKKSGSAIITATGYDADGNPVTASVIVKVLSEGDEGYQGNYTMPEVNKFSLSGYTTNKAYYAVSSSERNIGITGGSYDFAGDYSLTMYPSESVTLSYLLDSYFPDKTKVTFKSGNSRIATVDEDGTIIAQAEGNTIISVNVTFDGKSTLYSARVSITVNDPFTISSIYLQAYKGLGGTVEIPSDRGITTIYAYAFSNYEYVDKDLENGDVIDDEDPYYIKQSAIGEDTITKIIIPEGVTEIQSYAFAKLTALEEVVLPTTLKRIGMGAFADCVKLTKINLENVQFINKQAFSNCAMTEVSLDSVVAIGENAFENCKLNYLVLPSSTQSIGIKAFYKNANLASVQFKAAKVKIGSYAFAECSLLNSVDINASVISSYSFYNCSNLSKVTLGKDVSVIGEFAFTGTNVSSFTVNSRNTELSAKENGALLYKGNELILVAPNYSGTSNALVLDAEYISSGAFAGNTKIFSVTADKAKVVGAYAFANCTNLRWISLKSVEEIENYAFYNTAIEGEFSIPTIKSIGNYAFALTDISSVVIGDNVYVGECAFAYCTNLVSVKIGDNVILDQGAFYCPITMLTYDNTQSLYYYTAYTYEVENPEDGSILSYSYYRYDYSTGIHSQLTQLVIGKNVSIGSYAFAGNANLESVTLGENAQIGDYAFFNDAALTSIDLSKVSTIGEYAFSGSRTQDYWCYNNTYTYAYSYETIGGKLTPVNYVYSSLAPVFTSVDLSNATYIGSGAFAFNDKLTTVVLSENLQNIEASTFAFCTSIKAITLPKNITYVGDYAFYNTSLETIDLSNIKEIGNYAFGRTPLKSVTLKEGAELGDNAFAYCTKLATVTGLNKVNKIGAYAFIGVALEDISLNASYVGDYAFAQSSVKTVKLGEQVAEFGENPFYACQIETFGKLEEVKFNDKVVKQEIQSTYDVSNTVKVINGVLYQVVPNGLELVSYPILSEDTQFTVEEGTVRISARAFVGANLQSITLPASMQAIGDKAFYNCDDLAMVVFTSYNAPILEEEYDSTYANQSNMPFTGYYGEFTGLGITPYYMWNASTNANDFYYGANFVNYIGHLSSKLVMVRPSNGQGYDTFILSQYFGVKVDGSNAATTSTEMVIALIDALPSTITLSNENDIIAARLAYDSIPSVEQQALVTNYSVLVDAETKLEYLKYKNTPPETPIEIEEPEPSAFVTFLQNNMVGLIIAVVLLLCVVGLVVYIIIDKKKNKSNN